MKIPLLFLGFGGAGLAAVGTGVGVYYGILGEGNKVQTQDNLKKQDSDFFERLADPDYYVSEKSPTALLKSNFFLNLSR